MLLVRILVGCSGERVGLPEPLGLCEACEESCVEEAVPPAAESPHVTGGVDYPDPPPTSGEHDPCWAPWGVHDDELPDERWVHNLEHGGVVLLYNCDGGSSAGPDGCADEVAELAASVEARGQFGILTPYSLLPARFAAVAWGHRYVTDCFDPDALSSFWDSHVNQAPESVTADPGASCEMP
jgi:hypothetical protein